MGEKRDGSSGFGQGEKKNARRRKGRPLQLEGGERESVWQLKVGVWWWSGKLN